MERKYTPESIDNKVVACFDLKGSEHGEMNCGIVECKDGFRLYVFQDGEEQASIGADTLKSALGEIEKIEKMTGATMHFGSGSWK